MDFDSILHQYQKAYYNLPCGVKKFLGALYGQVPVNIRFGKNFPIHQKIIEKFEKGDEQFKIDFQFNKTVETLQFAYDNIPYYRKLFDENSFKITDFKDFSDLKKIPRLTKEIIQKEIENLYTDKFDKPVKYFTGGSSSTPMKIYSPLSVSRAKEKAYILHTIGKIRYVYRDPVVHMMSRGKADESKRKYWEYQKVDNFLLISVLHLRKEFIKPIFEEIEKFKPKYFFGFPSAIVSFIKACSYIGIKKVDNIKGVVLYSESVSLENIDFIKSFFNAPIMSDYGHTERVIYAYRIDKENYNFMNSYGLTKIVDDEIVGTSFDNFVMPYINYSTRDYIIGDVNSYKGTDIVKSVSNIQGRIQEFVVTNENIVIPILTIGAGHFNSYDYIDKAQFYQDTPGKITLFIESSHPELVQKEKIVKQMHIQVNRKIDFEVKFIEKIAMTHRRKEILCIQKLDIEKYRNMNKQGTHLISNS